MAIGNSGGNVKGLNVNKDGESAVEHDNGGALAYQASNKGSDQTGPGGRLNTGATPDSDLWQEPPVPAGPLPPGFWEARALLKQQMEAAKRRKHAPTTSDGRPIDDQLDAQGPISPWLKPSP